MRAAFAWCLPGLLSLTLVPGSYVPAQSPLAADSPGPQTGDGFENPKAIYPQIVRLSYVEGDVRLSRGKAGEKATGDAWEKAAVDVPLETGFTLVTGKGRAEIEFEDASTAYLAEDSVLTFGDLTSRAEVPSTVLDLLSGAMTLRLQTSTAGERYLVQTPADSILLQHPTRAYVRINSYLDALGFTSLGAGFIAVPTRSESPLLSYALAEKPLAKDLTHYYSGGRRLHVSAHNADTFTAWDQWVDGRVKAHDAAMSDAMKEAGLTAPLPGLAELAHAGHFFPCEPYGTCWQPSDPPSDNSSQTAALRPALLQTFAYTLGPHRQGPSPSLEPAAWEPPSPPIAAAPAGFSGLPQQIPPVISPIDPLTSYSEYQPFPCSPYGIRSLYAPDPLTGRMSLIGTTVVAQYGDWRQNWAFCHAGTWIQHRHRYAWVVGTHHHHRCPVLWVKNGHAAGYVPLHPRDVPGKTPLNLQHGFYLVRDAKAGLVEHVSYTPGGRLEVLNEPPKEFRKDSFMPLERASAPLVQARVLNERSSPGKNTSAGTTARNELRFDHRSQGFVLAHQVTEGTRTHTTTIPLSGRNGAIQTGGSGGSFRGGGSGFRAGGGSFRGNTGGGYTRSGGGGGGNAGRSGGGSSSSGGSHSASSAASAPSASSGASAGGSHK